MGETKMLAGPEALVSRDSPFQGEGLGPRGTFVPWRGWGLRVTILP